MQIYIYMHWGFAPVAGIIINKILPMLTTTESYFEQKPANAIIKAQPYLVNQAWPSLTLHKSLADVIGARCARPTLVVKTEICLYICLYIWYVRIPYIHSALFVRYAIFPHSRWFM